MRTLLFILFILTHSVSWTQLTSNSKVSVLTCMPGNELYSLFGHTALRIQDETLGIDRVYNYGMFDFRTPNFYLKFVKGDLQYFVNSTSYEEFIYGYIQEQRSVFSQEVDLTIVEKNQLFKRVENSLFTNERLYTYRFIDKNCTNMVSDKINEVMNNDHLVKINPEILSYRNLLNTYLDTHFIEKVGINLIFGLKTDRNADRLFLPNDLMVSLNTIKRNNENLSEPIETLHLSETTFNAAWWNSPFVFWSILVFPIFVLRKSYAKFLSAIWIVLGVFFISIGFYSHHQEVQWNLHSLLFNPIWSLAFVKRNYHTTWNYLLYILVFIHFLYCAITKQLGLLFPFHIISIWMLYSIFYKRKESSNLKQS